MKNDDKKELALDFVNLVKKSSNKLEEKKYIGDQTKLGSGRVDIWRRISGDVLLNEAECFLREAVEEDKGYCSEQNLVDEKDSFIQDSAKCLALFSNEELGVSEEEPHHIKNTIFVFRELGKDLLKEEYQFSFDRNTTSTELNDKLRHMQSANPMENMNAIIYKNNKDGFTETDSNGKSDAPKM